MYKTIEKTPKFSENRESGGANQTARVTLPERRHLVGTSVGMGNLDTKGHAFAAKITFSH